MYLGKDVLFYKYDLVENYHVFSLQVLVFLE